MTKQSHFAVTQTLSNLYDDFFAFGGNPAETSASGHQNRFSLICRSGVSHADGITVDVFAQN